MPNTHTKNEWRRVKFKDFVALNRGFDLPIQNRVTGKYPVIASTSITDFHSDFKVKGPVVTTGRSGALGEVLYFDYESWPLNTTLYSKNFYGNDPKFVYYKLKTLDLAQYNSGSGVPTLNKNHLDTIEIKIPNLETQQKIASVLSAYDDLIENNNKRIKVLEQMAQKLYTEWFVNFKFPDHEKVKMVDSGNPDFGMVPEGWEVKKLSEISSFKKGKNITKNTITEGSIPVVAGGLEPAYFHNTPNASAPVLTISASGANSGFANIYFQNIWASDCSYLNYKNTDYLFFIYTLLKVNQKKLFELQRGSAQPHVYPKDIEGLKFVLPKDQKILSDFEKISKDMYQGIRILKSKNQNLKSARDFLIPQLVGGKLLIKE